MRPVWGSHRQRTFRRGDRTRSTPPGHAGRASRGKGRASPRCLLEDVPRMVQRLEDADESPWTTHHLHPRDNAERLNRPRLVRRFRSEGPRAEAASTAPATTRWDGERVWPGFDFTEVNGKSAHARKQPDWRHCRCLIARLRVILRAKATRPHPSRCDSMSVFYCHTVS
jgi:hypothetical protein